MKALALTALLLLVTADGWCTPYWMVNGGSNGAAEQSSIGVEVGDTQMIVKRFPLAAELSMNFDFGDVPSEARFNNNPNNEPFTVKKAKDGPEIGFLFKSGVNLDDFVPNLTLLVGAGYALQSETPVATGANSGTHWQQGSRETEVYPVGYGGLLYRLERMCLSVGYNNRRGVVAGIGSNW
ncbi:hypothetical protein [Geomesophilobacter sediminis]|uniref:Uncharacterized protein n=1 Tax=Geomesophilobacter sediminis TaxID=2798584 RepID=A0A8J7J0B0_9BACT|nr:hypothetical protein [Geomesophilobacter sediminis]MBJ6723763.1 hypothetical protein [Geomesophilobacter sediminis]